MSDLEASREMVEKRKIKVLYIDDKLGDQALMEDYLSQIQYFHINLTIRPSLQTGLAEVVSGSFDIILVELDLPDSPKEKTLKSLTSHLDNPSVIVVSNESNPELILNSVHQGAQDYLLKSELQAFNLEKAIYFCIERKGTNAKLELSEHQYRNLFEINPESTIITDFETGKIVSVNNSFSQVFGWSIEECIGKTTMELNLWHSLQERFEILDRIPEEGEIRHVRADINRKDGHTLPCALSFTSFLHEGQRFIMGLIVNLEEQVKQKNLLELEKERFRALVESAPDLFFYSSAPNKIDYVCPQVFEHLNYRPEELLEMNFMNLLTEESKRVYAKMDWVNLFKAKENIVYRPFELKTKTGKVKQYELRLIPVEDKKTNRVVFVQGIARDITEELETFRLLEQSNQNNIKALEELKTHQYAIDQHNMVVITDIDGKIKFANENFLQSSGYKASELIGESTRIFNSGVHDALFFRDLWETVLAGRVWKGHICNRRKDGSLIWLATTIIPRLSQEGRVTEFIALRTDINDLKVAEKALKESEGTLRNVLNSNPHDIWSVNTNYQLQTFNEIFRTKFSRFMGHELSQGECMIDIPVLPEEVRQDWKLRYDLAFQGEQKEYREKHPDPLDENINRYFSVIVYPTYNEDGEITGAGVFSQDITEREQAKEGLRESNIRLQEAQAQAQVGDWYFNTVTEKFFWSKSLNKVLGLPENIGSPEEIQSLLHSVREEDQAKLTEAYSIALSSASYQKIIVEYQPPDGGKKWMECGFKGIADTQGNTTLLRGVIRDVTDLVQVQQSESLQKKLFIELANNGSEILRLNTVQAVYESLSDSIFSWYNQEVMVGTGDVIFKGEDSFFKVNSHRTPEQYKKEFQFLNTVVNSKQYYPSILPIKEPLQNRQVLHLSQDMLPLIPFINKQQLKVILEKMPDFALVAMGIFYKKEFKGTCFILFPEGLPENYSDQMVEILGNQASTVMDLIEHRNELKQNALVLNQALEAANSAVWRYDFKNQELIGDSKLYTLLGLPADHSGPISEQTLGERVEGKYIDQMLELLSPAHSGATNAYQFEYRFRCFDDTYKFFEDRAKITERDESGRALEIIGIRTDITNRKKREEQLLLLESSVNNANEGILITDSNIENGGPFIAYGNKAMEKISGYSIEELIGKSPGMLQGPLTDYDEVDRMNAAISKHEPVETEVINYHKNGQPYYVSISIVPIRNKDGEVTHFVALERDTTVEHQQRKELRELLIRLELATKATGIGVWDYDVVKDHLTWDENMFKVYQAQTEGFSEKLADWEQTIVPEDRERTKQVFLDAINSSNDNANFRFRIQTSSGIRHISTIAQINRNASGEAVRVVGLNWDITEIEQSRLELDKIRLNMEALINNTGDHMWSINPRFRLLSANNGYLDYLEDLCGKRLTVGDTVLDPELGKERNQHWKVLYEKALSGEKVEIQLKDVSKYGSKILVVSLYPIRNAQNIITGVACYSFDDTERVNSLETIKQQNQQLRDIAWMQSHVMRAPVARVLGLIELLKEESQVSEETREILKYIQESSQEMDQVIKDITEKTQRSGIELE